MRDGSLQCLDTAVGLYDRGGIDNPGKSALIAPRGLTGVNVRRWRRSCERSP
jgi:hypothetical protein